MFMGTRREVVRYGALAVAFAGAGAAGYEIPEAGRAVETRNAIVGLRERRALLRRQLQETPDEAAKHSIRNEYAGVSYELDRQKNFQSMQWGTPELHIGLAASGVIATFVGTGAYLKRAQEDQIALPTITRRAFLRNFKPV